MSIRTTFRVVLLATVVLAAGGCSFFGKKSSYEQAQASRPLEVPPDLDTPSTAGSLSIPETGTGATADGSAPSDAPSDAPAPEIVAGEDSSMSLADSPAGAWRRVGIALERSQVGEITARDEATATYTLSGMTRVAAKDDRGFFKKMFTSEKSESTQVTRVVRISADGDGSRVTVEDEGGQQQGDEFARRIISALKQRLG
jgi:uncharacterized lipoprotein